MTKRRWTPRLLAAMSLWIISAGAAVARPPGDWHTDYASAMAEAKRTGKPILADFSASWCGACKQMEKTTFRDPNVNARLDNYVKLYVDFDANPEVAQKYDVKALPTLVAMSPQGQVMERNVGYMSSQQMSGVLDNVMASVPKSAPKSTPKPAAKTPKPEVVSASADRETNTRETNARTAPATTRDGDNRVAQNRNSTTLRPVSTTQRSATEPRTTAANTSGIHIAANRTTEGSAATPRAETRNASTREISLYNLSETETSRGSRSVAQSDDDSARSETSRRTDAGGSPPRQPMGGGGVVNESDEPATPAAQAPTENSAAARLLRQPPTIDGASNNTEMVLRAQRDLNARPSSILAQVPSDDSGMPRPLIDAGSTRDAAATPAGRAGRTSTSPRSTATPSTSSDPAAESRASDTAAETPAPARARATATPAPTAPATASGTRGASASTSGIPDSLRRVQRSKAATPIAPARVAENSGSSTTEPPPTEATATPASGAASTTTADDIERWLKDGDTKLGQKKMREARAMYTKIVEADPTNKFGRSDLAFIKMVSSMVDKDEDSVRRAAYNKIKEFPAKYPVSESRDYYVLVRAMLAVDLGEKSEAKKLLATYPDDFPNSRYLDPAKSIWDEVKNAPSSTPRPAATPRSSASGANRTGSSGSSLSSGSSSRSTGTNGSAASRSAGTSSRTTPRTTPRSGTN